MIAERRGGAHDPGDLLSMLLAARDPETGAGMSDEQLRAEILTFLIAGYETTSAALESVHRNPAFWADPERFDPERFAPEQAKQRPRYAHIPFGGGPRQCIGNAFALMELQVVIPTLIGALRFELAPGADPTPQPRMTLRPRGPLLMNVRPA